jgi:epoxyqueuosine reductase QueG
MPGLTQEVKDYARREGAHLVGIASAEAFEDARTRPRDLLPGARSVVVLAMKILDGACRLLDKAKPAHPRMYFTSLQIQGPEINQVGHRLAVFLEEKGYEAVMVRAYYGAPLDAETKGMIGDFDMVRAGYEAGLGEMGDSNLLLTPEYGPRIWLVPVITTAPLQPDGRFQGQLCDHCNDCIDNCPPQALTGRGQIDRDSCLRYNEPESLGGTIRFLTTKIVGKSEEEQIAAFRSPRFWNIWYFLLYGGLSYTCGRCLRICHVGYPEERRKYQRREA